MTKRVCLVWAFCALLMQPCTTAAAPPTTTHTPSSSHQPAHSRNGTTLPHLLFVVVDDHGWFDLGYTGARTHTPIIDKFARSGVRLMQAYVQKVCSPTRTAIMTGRYPHRMGMQTPFCGGMPEGLNLNETLTPQHLSTVGYIAHAVGKWHLGFTTWEHTPTFRGFQSFYGYYNCAEDYFSHSVPLRNASYGLDFHDDIKPFCGENCSRAAWEAAVEPDCYFPQNEPQQQCWPDSGNKRMCYSCDDWQHYSTHLITARAEKIIMNHPSDKPLYIYMALQDTHGPAEVPKVYRDAVPVSGLDAIPNPVRRLLAGKLRIVDEAILNVTNTLDSRNMLENTIIFYTTDNGGPIVPTTGAPDDALGASNWPLRGGKHNAYEGGVRGTAWLWDGRGMLHPKGAIDLQWHGLFHAVDWLPTICGIVGCDPTGKLPLDGVDASAAIASNGTSPRTSVVLDIEKPTGVYSSVGSGVVRSGEWKLMIGSSDPQRPGDWSNAEPWLNVTISEPTVPHGPYQLFNVIEDPQERHDRINDSSVPDGIVKALVTMYAHERAVAVYPFELGPAGKPNQEGVWVPWLQKADLLSPPAR